MNYFENASVILTGGTGFIGSNLMKSLEKLGAEVHIFSRPESDRWRLQKIENKATLHLVEWDKTAHIATLIREINPHYVFHFAQPNAYHLNEKTLVFELSTSGRMIGTLMEAISKCQRLISFVHACSFSVYSSDSSSGRLSENTPMNPYNYRGVVKLNERNMTKVYASELGIPVRLARIFRAYGPYENAKFIYRAMQSLEAGEEIRLANDKFTRDYVYVEDLVKGILALASARLTGFTEVNFSGGLAFTAREVLESLEQVIGKKAIISTESYPRNKFDHGKIQADISLAKSLLGWSPEVSLMEGLRKTYECYHLL